ncbi:MAG: TetR/AcrR family transcriptional regulator [Thermoplasmata archaeon]
MPKVVAGYKTQARARIIAAASTVFRRKGFRNTTMDDIAREIGVSKGALYLYFATKNDLLGAIQAKSRRTVLQKWERLLEEGDVAEGIVRPLDVVFDGRISPSIYLELIAASPEDPELRKVLRQDSLEDRRTMERFLRKLQDRGRIPRDRNARVMAHTVLVLLRGAVQEMMTDGQPNESRRELIRSLRFVLGT